jgi:hypothetical protein
MDAKYPEYLGDKSIEGRRGRLKLMCRIEPSKGVDRQERALSREASKRFGSRSGVCTLVKARYRKRTS